MKIVFYIEDGNFWDICFNDLNKCEDVKIIKKSERFAINQKKIKKICDIHNSVTLNKKFSLPFRWVWNNVDQLEKLKNRNEPTCFVFTDTSIRNVTVHTLKSIQNAGHKIVVFFLNPLRNQNDVGYALTMKNKISFERVYTIDQSDADCYGFTYCNCCYSKIDLEEKQEFIDVLYVGKNKGRSDTILDLATKMQKFNCKFYITDVPKAKQRNIKNVIYGQGMPYLDVLNLVKKSRCILECVQEGQEGFTFRFYEAICYNKKLITNNLFVRKSSYFSEEFMYIIDDENDNIDEFISNKMMPAYCYTDEFSPSRFVEKIRMDIS